MGSPLESCNSLPERKREVPPNLCIPASKETLVLVEGCSKTSPKTLFFNVFLRSDEFFSSKASVNNCMKIFLSNSLKI
jgi:hypothetical protein